MVEKFIVFLTLGGAVAMMIHLGRVEQCILGREAMRKNFALRG